MIMSIAAEWMDWHTCIVGAVHDNKILFWRRHTTRHTALFSIPFDQWVQIFSSAHEIDAHFSHSD